jgi:alkylresorcinol/alkylpyrone synthase
MITGKWDRGTITRRRVLYARSPIAPTVFFVLERVLKQGLPPRSVLSVLRPGFTASLVSLKRAA